MTSNSGLRGRANLWLAREDDDPQIVVVGVPFSRASKPPGRADLTPGAVRERLEGFSTFDKDRKIVSDEIRVTDHGNWAVSELGAEEMLPAVERLARELPESALTLFLGGDNAITRPLIRSLGDLSDIGLLAFDARHDAHPLDAGPVGGTQVRGLVDEDGLPGGNIHQIGIRAFANSLQDRSYCDEAGIRVTTIEEVGRAGIGAAVEAALADMGERCGSVYVDVDLSVLDVANAPACPGALPGGMTMRELSEGVRLCGADPKVRAIDFVGVDASADPHGITLDALALLMLSAFSGFSSRS